MSSMGVACVLSALSEVMAVSIHLRPVYGQKYQIMPLKCAEGRILFVFFCSRFLCGIKVQIDVTDLLLCPGCKRTKRPNNVSMNSGLMLCH